MQKTRQPIRHTPGVGRDRRHHGRRLELRAIAVDVRSFVEVVPHGDPVKVLVGEAPQPSQIAHLYVLGPDMDAEP